MFILPLIVVMILNAFDYWFLTNFIDLLGLNKGGLQNIMFMVVIGSIFYYLEYVSYKKLRR